MSEFSFAQKVEKKAHEFFEKRGHEHGHDWDDWFEAEKIVEAKISVVEKDCIRSESFYETSHRPLPLPSDIDARKINERLQGQGVILRLSVDQPPQIEGRNMW
jgi:hypothetical protein